MRIFADRDKGKLILGPGTTQLLQSIREKRGPATEIEVQFLRGITPQELPADASGKFEVKVADEFDSQPVTAALAWVKTGTGVDTIYTFTLGLMNAVLDALLGVEDPVLFTVVAATDLFTSTAHGLVAGNVIQFNSDDTLPAGISPNTDYFVIASGLTANNFRVSTTLGGSTIDVTDTGTGNHYWTQSGNDIESVTLMAAMEWTADGRTNETQTIDFILENDIVRPGDVPPSTPALAYAIFWPEVTTMAAFKAVPTPGLNLGYLVEILIDVAGTTTLLKYRLVTGPVSEAEPEHVEPDDYDLGTNDRHWEGAAGPAGPPGEHAGIPYKWNTNTAATDPTAGKVKVNHATLASATALYISETDDEANALAALLATFDDGTSTIRGQIIFRDPATPANFAVFNITGAITDNGAWDTFVIAHVVSGGTLTNNLPVRMFFIPKGDKGDTGTGGATGATGATGFLGASRYLWNTSTANTDPTAGHLKVNNGTLSSATALYISETDNDANAIAAVLAKWDDSTSTIKGQLRIYSTATPTIFAIFNITGTLTDNGTWDTFTIAFVASGGTLTNDMPVSVVFIPTGDQGSSGATTYPASAAITAGTSQNIDWATLTTAQRRTLSGNTTFTHINMVDGKVIIIPILNTGSNYTVTWVGVNYWVGTGGATPVQSVGAVVDVWTFWYDGNFTYGAHSPGV